MKTKQINPDMKIITSILILGITLLGIGIGSFAYFSDTETSTGNTITAGTLDMTLNYFIWEFPFDDMKPGHSTGVQEIILEIPATSNTPNHIEIDIDTKNFIDSTIESGGLNTQDDFTKQIRVDTLTYDGVNLLPLVDDNADTNPGFTSLYDVESHGIFDNLPTIDNGFSAFFRVQLSLPDDLPDTNDNKYQGDSLEIDFEFGTAQVTGQNVLSN